ncbi:MAG: hypothetical protein COX57_12555 [Alphaproteobacteria bacterium CG_4_10_14_0_2_um_filter_63_37]|nr:MAG: hypothetical protein AUJ55_07165 [Proteobacteria bacterium CG1_02_64_396]PJA23661.1 MAG: hypothetical protein COX57_12555 [Alphaproteobacteria bacterium CG_4_10_14_0_2_um_filter_63_37]
MIRPLFTLLIPSWLFLLGASWTADGLRDGWLSGTLADPWGLAIALLCFLGGAFWLYHVRQAFLPLATFREGDRPAPHAALVLLVSPPKPEQPPIDLSGNLNQDIAALDASRWNWQQLLRAIQPHVATARHVVLIGSSGKEGSYHHLETCQTLLARYLPTATFTQAPAVDFQKLEATRETIEQIFADLRQQGVPERQILIDVTGGTKTASIAAALATLRHHRVEFQYVEGGSAPLIYNVVSQAPATLDS